LVAQLINRIIHFAKLGVGICEVVNKICSRVFLWWAADPAAEIISEDVVVANHRARSMIWVSLYGFPASSPISRRSSTAVKMTSIGSVVSYEMLAILLYFSPSFLAVIFP